MTLPNGLLSDEIDLRPSGAQQFLTDESATHARMATRVAETAADMEAFRTPQIEGASVVTNGALSAAVRMNRGQWVGAPVCVVNATVFGLRIVGSMTARLSQAVDITHSVALAI
jgi:hypothetical protein